MFGIIRVNLIGCELTGEQHLHQIATEFQAEIGTPRSTSKGLRDYISKLTPVYVSVPRTSSRASFVWGDVQGFEIIVETSAGANMISIIEAIENRLSTRMKQLGLGGDITASISSSEDMHSYIFARRASLVSLIWADVQEAIIALVIAIVLAILAKQYFPTYVEEALANCVGFFILSSYLAIKSVVLNRGRRLQWSLT